MKVAFDTSLIVAAVVAAHPQHARARIWFNAAINNQIKGFASWHAIAEAWAVLTRMPLNPAISGESAHKILQRIEKIISLSAVSANIYREAIERCASLSLRSGVIFDAIHTLTAEKVATDIILTFNLRDFQRLATSFSPRIVEPPNPPSINIG